MIDKLRQKYARQTIAVLGSAPSIKYYKHREDITIGTNGTYSLLRKTDIHLSGDEQAANRTWFEELDKEVLSILRVQAAIYSKRHFPEEIRKKLIREYEKYMNKHPKEVLWVPGQNFKYLPADNVFMNKHFIPNLPEPLSNSLVLKKSRGKKEPVTLDQTVLNIGGTSAGMATQLAFIMGARKIVLYGVEFSNPSNDYKGGNYFYSAKKTERGQTTEEQREIMDDMIIQIMSQGVPVISVGPTKLKNTVKLEPQTEEEQQPF